MKIIKKLFGLFLGLIFLLCLYMTLTDTKNIVINIFMTAITGYISFILLFRKSKTVDTSLTCIETDSNAVWSDVQKITDEDVSYLTQVTTSNKDKIRAKGLIPQYICLIQDSYSLMCSTDNPSTLCDRYNFSKQKLDELIYFYNQGWCSNLDKYIKMLSEENFCNLICSCYKRYVAKASSELKTVKGIDNRIQKFWEIIQDNVSTNAYLQLRKSNN